MPDSFCGHGALSVRCGLAGPGHALDPAGGRGRPPPARRYEGGWTDWPKTGDWGGAGTDLENLGIRLELDVSQIFQHNAHGGAQTDKGARCSGSGDLTRTLDTQKMGLWPAGTFVINAEPKWGNGLNAKTGALLPVNYGAAKPGAEECMMTLSEWFWIQGIYQGLAGKAALVLGRVDLARGFATNAFANVERTQFMNVGLRNNPQLGAVVGYTPLAAAPVWLPTDWLTIWTVVGDSDGQASRTGFDSAFHGDAENFAVATGGSSRSGPSACPAPSGWPSAGRPRTCPMSIRARRWPNCRRC